MSITIRGVFQKLTTSHWTKFSLADIFNCRYKQKIRLADFYSICLADMI